MRLGAVQGGGQNAILALMNSGFPLVSSTRFFRASYGWRRFVFKNLMPAITLAFCAGAVSAEQATLQWTDNSSNEDGFYVERATNGGDWTRIATVAADATTYIDTSVVANDVYQYRVNAFNSFGTSGYTNTAVFEIVSLPPAIAAIADRAVEANSIIAPIAIALSDPDTAAEAIELTVLSNALGLLNSDGIAITGSGADRALQLTPVMDASGVVTVTLIASDGRNETQTSFNLTINEPVVPAFQLASITTNAAGLVPNGQSVSAQISTDRPDLLERVEYWIDNTLVATSSAAPFSAALVLDQEGVFDVVATGFLARSQMVVTDSLTIAVAPEPTDSALVEGLTWRITTCVR